MQLAKGKHTVHHKTCHEGTEEEALGEGGWLKPRPGRFSPGNDPVPIVLQVAWVPGLVWTGAKNLPPPPPQGFDPQIVQPIASRYTDYLPRPIGVAYI